MKNKNKTKKIFSLALIFASVTWFFAIAFFVFIEFKNNQNAVLADEITEQTSRIDEINNLSRDTRVLREKLEELDQLFIDDSQESIVIFIEEIESISKVSGAELIISDVKISSLEEVGEINENFENIDLRIEADGSWRQVYYFLNLLENLPYNIIFKKTKISSASDNNDLGWKAYFDISVSKIK